MPKAKKSDTLVFKLEISLPLERQVKILRAVAAFNGLSLEMCASKMMVETLNSLEEELNFRGAMQV